MAPKKTSARNAYEEVARITKGVPGECRSEEKQLSYRENLSWAVDAAGEFLRTGKLPRSAPNNAAFFLYEQAVKSPKEFLTKLNQLEAKRTERDSSLKRACRLAIEEIDEMLASLGRESVEPGKDPS